MWAPADLFTPIVSAVGRDLRDFVTLIWRHPLATFMIVAGVIALIVLVNALRR